LKLSEVYSAFNDLDDVIGDLKGMSNHCEARGVFKVSVDRSHVSSMLSKSKKAKEALKALLDELEIGNKQD
jgi:hypothetical protein